MPPGLHLIGLKSLESDTGSGGVWKGQEMKQEQQEQEQEQRVFHGDGSFLRTFRLSMYLVTAPQPTQQQSTTQQQQQQGKK